MNLINTVVKITGVIQTMHRFEVEGNSVTKCYMNQAKGVMAELCVSMGIFVFIIVPSVFS